MILICIMMFYDRYCLLNTNIVYKKSIPRLNFYKNVLKYIYALIRIIQSRPYSHLISICLISLVICMLGIFKIIPALIIALIIFAVFLVSDKNILTGVDYSLLLTFFAFFIFIGNIKNIEVFRNFLSFAIEGHVKAVAVLTSQIISNVPSALLLSGFTDNWKELIIGCNIGGLGTLIASMASLISYKILVQQYPKFKKQYYIFFSESNFALLIILLIIALII